MLALLIGLFGGLLSAIFSHLLTFVTSLREIAPWLLLLLPVGGIATVILYRTFHMKEYGGTNQLVQCLKNNHKIKPATAPLIFIATAITHLFGGSAGREGAALQLGGSFASTVSDFLRLKDDERTTFVMSGMSAVFAGMFGTPLTAAFFVLEFKLNKKSLSLSLLPCLISAIVAKQISAFMGVLKETAYLKTTLLFSVSSLGKVVALAIGLGLLSVVMCFVFAKAQWGAQKIVSNSYLRIVLGAIIIIGLTALVGDMRYNGSGMDMALSAIEGEANRFDFILKIIFTAITLAAGFKGGQIVPTFCVGATFGCVFGNLLGLDARFSAALGLVGLFCCATNSFVSAVFLGIELFGFSALPYFIIVCLVLWLLPTSPCLFENRLFKSPFVLKLGNRKTAA